MGKDAVRAFAEGTKKKPSTKGKVMKSKLSEIESKVAQDKKDYTKSLNKRELAGKSARELAEKAARAASAQLKALREAKSAAAVKLTESRKAKAQVDLIHTKTKAEDMKEYVTKTSAHEARMKIDTAAADKRLGKLKTKAEKNFKAEKGEEMNQKGEGKKAAKQVKKLD